MVGCSLGKTNGYDWKGSNCFRSIPRLPPMRFLYSAWQGTRCNWSHCAVKEEDPKGAGFVSRLGLIQAKLPQKFTVSGPHLLSPCQRQVEEGISAGGLVVLASQPGRGGWSGPSGDGGYRLPSQSWELNKNGMAEILQKRQTEKCCPPKSMQFGAIFWERQNRIDAM